MQEPGIQTSSPAQTLDLSACDREPIHIPASIQPHGLLLIADRGTLAVVAAAGDVEARLSPDWLGADLRVLLACEDAILTAQSVEPALAGVRLGAVRGSGETFDAVLHRSGQHLLVELEPSEAPGRPAATVLGELELAATRFERAPDLRSLCGEAADAFRALTGFDRVMIYISSMTVPAWCWRKRRRRRWAPSSTITFPPPTCRNRPVRSMCATVSA